MNGVIHDLRYALRQLRKSPGFTSVVIITLALGIGAATAIMSVVDTVLLHSEPYARPGELVGITERGPTTAPGKQDGVSAGDFTDWQMEIPVYAGIAAYQPWEFHTLTGGDGDPDEVWASPVTPNLFQVLGVSTVLGRTFTPNETQAVVLSHQYWESHFASDPRIVGKALALDGKLYQVIGVAPADFEFPAANAQMWTPLTFSAADRANHESRKLSVVARLSPGITLQQAQAVMDTVTSRLAAQQPKTNSGWSASLAPFRTPELQRVLRDTILALLGAVIFMLLIVCANVANMLLARGTERQGEIAIRAALGASRPRLVRQLLVEAVLLAAASGIGGLILARLGLAMIVSLVPKYNLIETQALHHISMNLTALGFAGGCPCLPELPSHCFRV